MRTTTISWQNGSVELIDQTLLPGQLKYLVCRDVRTLWSAIKTLKVRGAPALGVAAGFGVLLGVRAFRGNDRRAFERRVHQLCDYIGSSRPTAVNLFYVLGLMKQVLLDHPSASVPQLKTMLKRKALEVYEEDRRVCRRMGRFGSQLIPAGGTVMTVCNAGALATVDYGTALGVMYAARSAGKRFKVVACETRPLLQGARLTAWELMRAGIDTTLICDNMAATLMKQGKIKAVFTGADRIAANGDAANKIGTYMLAVLAKHHRVPFYVVAPLSTFDPKIRNGKGIPIEERRPDEVTHFAGKRTAPDGVKVYNPAFDVTDHRLITALVTERGVLYPPFRSAISKVFHSAAR